MKKRYIKPRVTEIPPGFGRIEENRFIRTEHHKYDASNPIPNPYPGMTDEEVRKHLAEMHIKILISKIPDEIVNDNNPRLKAIFQKIFNTDLHDLRKRHPGYSKELLIQNLKQDFADVAAKRDTPRDQIRAVRFLKFLNKLEKEKSDPELSDSKFTVKSIILAYYYMYNKSIYPIPELKTNPLVLKTVHDKLHDRYGFSSDLFKNDWNPIFGKKGSTNRLAWIPNIELAIELLQKRYSTYPGIDESIKLARKELQEAELGK